MTKTKFWLSILAISVVLIAGSLAASPIAIADDDDDDDFDEIIAQETYNLAGLPAGGAVIVIDTTPVAMDGAHIAAVLPTTDNGDADNCGSEDTPQLTVVAGAAPSVGGVISEANIVTALGPLPANINGAGDDMCVYHRTITASDTPASALTDIAVVGGSSAAPAGSSITVTAFED